jgi:hypothetical protein
MSFFKNRGYEGKRDPVWGLVPMGGRRIYGKGIGK